MECLENMKTVYPDENNVVLNENSVERKPCINRESKSDEITIKLYSCHDINTNFLIIVTPLSIYHKTVKALIDVSYRKKLINVLIPTAQ